MGNIPMPFHDWALNGWTAGRKYLVCKTLSMFACVIGSVVYMSPLEPYLEEPSFGILVPTFLTGYILVHSSDMFLLLMRTEYIFLEMCFSVIGAMGSLTCGIYQLQKWIVWLIDTARNPDGDYDFAELMLALALLLQFASQSCVILFRILEHFKPQNLRE